MDHSRKDTQRQDSSRLFTRRKAEKVSHVPVVPGGAGGTRQDDGLAMPVPNVRNIRKSVRNAGTTISRKIRNKKNPQAAEPGKRDQ